MAIEFFRFEVAGERFDDRVVLRTATCRERLDDAVRGEQFAIRTSRIVGSLIGVEDKARGRLSYRQGVGQR